MYALQITDSKGAPQGWTQDGMYMATWSLLIQFVMVLVTPCATGEPAQVDEDERHADVDVHLDACPRPRRHYESSLCMPDALSVRVNDDTLSLYVRRAFKFDFLN